MQNGPGQSVGEQLKSRAALYQYERIRMDAPLIAHYVMDERMTPEQIADKLVGTNWEKEAPAQSVAAPELGPMRGEVSDQFSGLSEPIPPKKQTKPKRITKKQARQNEWDRIHNLAVAVQDAVALADRQMNGAPEEAEAPTEAKPKKFIPGITEEMSLEERRPIIDEYFAQRREQGYEIAVQGEELSQAKRAREKAEAEAKAEADRKWRESPTYKMMMLNSSINVNLDARMNTDGDYLTQDEIDNYAYNPAGKDEKGRMLSLRYQNPNGQKAFVMTPTIVGEGYELYTGEPLIQGSDVKVYMIGSKRLDSTHKTTVAEAKVLNAEMAKRLKEQRQNGAKAQFQFGNGPLLLELLEAAQRFGDTTQHPGTLVKELVTLLGYDIVEMPTDYYLGRNQPIQPEHIKQAVDDILDKYSSLARQRELLEQLGIEESDYDPFAAVQEDRYGFKLRALVEAEVEAIAAEEGLRGSFDAAISDHFGINPPALLGSGRYVVYGEDQVREQQDAYAIARKLAQEKAAKENGAVSAFAVESENTETDGDETYERADYTEQEAEEAFKRAWEEVHGTIFTNVGNNPDYAEQGEKFGTFTETNNPRSRETDIPRKQAADSPNSRTIANALTDARLDAVALKTLTDAAARGDYVYATTTNKEQLDEAMKRLQRVYGYKSEDGELRIELGAAVKGFMKQGDSVKVRDLTKYITEGELIYNTLMDPASATFGGKLDQQLYEDNCVMGAQVLANIATVGGETAQGLQALSTLKKMGRIGRMTYANRAVETFLDKLSKTKRGVPEALKKWKMSDATRKAFETATTEAEYDAAEQMLIDEIVPHVPATLKSRALAYRYLCMLGNPRTHIRNIVSNAAMYVMSSISDALAGVAEDIADKAGVFNEKGSRRYTTARPTKEMRDYARLVWETQKDTIKFGGSKIAGSNFDAKLQESLHSFGDSPIGKALEWASKKSSELLSQEDMVFEGLHFRKAFAQWMAANGYTPEMFEEASRRGDKATLEKLAQGKAYAAQLALERTYNDANIVAQKISELEQEGGPLAELLIGGTVPFKRTPMNVLKQGLKYSPVGLASGIYAAATSESKADAISKIAQGATGTSLMALGLYLAMIGKAKAGGSDNDREEYYDQMLGQQQYSVTIGDTNFTLDWLTPASMPLFAGVALGKALQERAESGEWDDLDDTQIGEKIIDGLAKMADPVMNLSMLQGINDALNSYSDNKLGAFFKSAGESYALQFIPTLSGQIIRTMEDERKSTYAPKDADNIFGKEGAQFVNRLKNKSLVAHTLLGENEDYIDMWGRTEDREGNYLTRAFNQMVNPGYVKNVNKTAVDDQLAEIFAESHDRAILPSTPQSYITIDGEKDYLDSREYRDYKAEVGSISYSGLDSAFTSDLFPTLSTEGQAKVVKNIYDYAKDKAKADYANSKELELKENSDLSKVAEAERMGLSVGEYFIIKYGLSQCEGQKNAKGNTISGTLKKAKQDYLRSLGLSREQQDIFL